MTRDELAKLLDGREYREEITDAEEKEAKEAGLLVIYGASDDLCEFRGFFEDEFGCYGGGDVLFDAAGLLGEWEDVNETEASAADYLRRKADAVCVIIHWCEGDGPPWTYTFDPPIPHATFTIVEDGDRFCIGTVISREDLP